MTEQEWTACQETQRMLEWLRASGKLTDRKALLFAVACCRRIGHLLADARSREAVEVAEQHAEGVLGQDRLMAAWEPAWAAANEPHEAAMAAETTSPDAPWGVAHAAEAAANALAGQPVAAAAAALMAVLNSDGGPAETMGTQERQGQASLLRDMQGPLPFRPVALEPSWRTRAVVALATVICDERRFEDMPVLADALEEAGCDNEEILGHLRRQREVHARGCWVLDLLLQKE